jgi:hypothetical protein
MVDKNNESVEQPTDRIEAFSWYLVSGSLAAHPFNHFFVLSKHRVQQLITMRYIMGLEV